MTREEVTGTEPQNDGCDQLRSRATRKTRLEKGGKWTRRLDCGVIGSAYGQFEFVGGYPS